MQRTRRLDLRSRRRRRPGDAPRVAGGASTLLGATTLLGSFTAPQEITSAAYDPATGRLFILDNHLDRVLVFTPEPGTGALLSAGLLALAALRAGRGRRAG